MIPGIKKRGITFGDIMLYVAIAMKHFRLMVLLMCLSFTVGLFYYVYAKPVYYSKSLIRYSAVERPVDAATVFKEGTERDILAQLTAPHIIQRTAKRFGINEPYKVIYAKYIKSIAVRFNSEKNIEVDLYSYDKNLVRKWTEVMLNEYLQYRDEKRYQYRDSIIKSYTEEMKEVSKRMEDALKAKYQFQDEKKRTEILLKLEQLKDLPREITETSKRLTELDRIRATLSDPTLDAVEKLSLLSTLEKESTVRIGDVVSGGDSGDNKSKTIVVVPDMISHASPQGWEELHKQRDKLKLEIAEAEKKYLPAHPKMAELLRRLSEINKNLEAELTVAQNRYNLEYNKLLEKRKELMAKLPEYEKAVQDNEKYLQDLAVNEAGKLGWNTIYAEMAKKISMIDFGADKERVHLQFLQHLELRDEVPVSPNKIKLVLTCFVLGMMLAIGMPFLIEFLDHTVNDIEEVEQTYRIRGLGIVPKIDTRSLSGYPMTNADGTGDKHLVENFRVIRTNLLSVGAKTKNPQAISVVSAMPQEGKTMVAVNLALSFAHMGEKTLLIDADMRRGRIHRLFEFRSSPGLSNVLIDKIPWQEAVHDTEHENLFVFPCGKHIEGAREMIGTPSFNKLIDELRQNYQRIIIDTPPVLGLSETAMLQHTIDGVVFVIWSGRTPMRYIKSALDILASNNANVFGFVLNRLDLSGFSNYYNYYNYYYYSYNYYYSYKDKPKELKNV
ncbi:MAG: polysaccharide biosynthesis tyrosine autokinase [Verrucomicrobiia bacterium]